MQPIVDDSKIKKEIICRAKLASKRVLLFSAYCKEPIFSELCASISSNPNLDRILVVRWQMDDLVSGASDLNVYEIAKHNNWGMYLNNALHAKVFIFDNTAIIGSANLTRGGIAGQGLGGNIEVCSILECDSKLGSWVQNLLINSRQLDDKLYENICNEVELAKNDISESQLVKRRFSSHIHNLINAKSSNSLYIRDLFWLDRPDILLGETNKVADNKADIDHDLSLLGLDSLPIKFEKLRVQFECSKPFCWFKNAVGEEIYFGELTAILHNSLKDDPRPYRKDVKSLLQNMINWIQVLSSDMFIVDRPKNSQRIRSI